MGLRANPTQRQRRIGEELRKLREKSGMTAPAAGARVGLGRAHMSHIEAGRTAIPEGKLRALLRTYRCTSDALVEELVAMARATGRGWWSDYKRLLGLRACDLAELEATAVAHRSFDWLYVPGLLQTPAYMRSLFEREPHGSPADIDRYVEFRMRRQQILTREPPPEVHAVIHEAAFHMHFVERHIMREQIEHLIALAHWPHMRIQLLPFKAPACPPSPGTPFVICDSAAPELRTVHVEGPVTASFLGDEEQIDRFLTAFDRLSRVALGPLDRSETSTSRFQHQSIGLAHHLLYIL